MLLLYEPKFEKLIYDFVVALAFHCKASEIRGFRLVQNDQNCKQNDQTAYKYWNFDFESNSYFVQAF